MLEKLSNGRAAGPAYARFYTAVFDIIDYRSDRDMHGRTV
jgi:hypothetical protein